MNGKLCKFYFPPILYAIMVLSVHIRPFLFALILLPIASCSTPSAEEDQKFMQWTRYEAEPGASSFSALDQITRSNVDQLEVAWIYETPGAARMNPVIIDTVMYVYGDDGAVVALHAATGEEIWSHRNEYPASSRLRGIVYWESDDRSDRRLFHTSGSYWLVAVDAVSGSPIPSFGEDGKVDLRQGMGDDLNQVTRATSSTPGVIFDDLLIVGSSPGEGYIASPGHIRAFNVVTGELEWVFHTLPKPGEYGYDTWPEGRSEIGGGANAWGGLSVDDERGIVYVPLGSANYDFYGIDRHGENLFASSLVALDARTGERIWHFQTIHHDLWDYDLSATPVLMTIIHEGQEVDIVTLATKMGMIFTFNRETGEPIWPIEERPVPPSEIPGEEAWPTQPFPTKPAPFVPIDFDIENDLNPHLNEADRDSLVEMVEAMRWEGIYTPPSTDKVLQVPGNRGGANWGSTAADPRNGTFFVLSYNMPSVIELVPIVAGETGTGTSPYDRGQNLYRAQCQLCHGADRRGAGGALSLVGVTDRLARNEYEEVVRNGRGQMPGFRTLSEEQSQWIYMFLSNPDRALVPDQPLTSEEVPQTSDILYQSAWRHILDSKGLPIIKPPWFRLTAYDMNKGELIWQVPVGYTPHLVEQGFTDTGSSVFLKGGPAATAGDLIFMSTEDAIRAYDMEDGAELWSHDLPSMGRGKPSVYEVDGRQFVVVSASNIQRWGQSLQADFENTTPQYMAFTLPVTEP